MSHEEVASNHHLRCTWCGEQLYIPLETVGPAYMTYETVESIECNSPGCDASWEPDGTVRELPWAMRGDTDG